MECQWDTEEKKNLGSCLIQRKIISWMALKGHHWVISKNSRSGVNDSPWKFNEWIVEMMVAIFGTPWKNNMTLKVTIFKRKYIFKWWMFHCRVRFRKVSILNFRCVICISTVASIKRMNLKICHVLLVWPNRTLVRSAKPHIESLSGWRVADWWSFLVTWLPKTIFFWCPASKKHFWLVSFVWNNETTCVHFFQHHKWGKYPHWRLVKKLVVCDLWCSSISTAEKKHWVNLSDTYMYIYIYTWNLSLLRN